VDFAGVKFISRAAAHELITQVDKLSKTGIESTFKNLNEEGKNMLSLVKRSKENDKQSSFRLVKWLEFENEANYEEYLLQY